MEVKSKEQKTITYTLTLNSNEAHAVVVELNSLIDGNETRYSKTYSLYSKLSQAVLVEEDDE